MSVDGVWVGYMGRPVLRPCHASDANEVSGCRWQGGIVRDVSVDGVWVLVYGSSSPSSESPSPAPKK